MSSIDQTHKEYLAHQNGTVYWPFTAWDAIAGKPDDLAHKSDITVAINGLNKFDPNKVFTKDEVNAAIAKAIGDLQDKIYGGNVNAAMDTIKELQDAYNGSNTIIQRLLTQMANKANVGDSYTKGDSDARYPLKADIPDITPLAKQVDLSLVEKYGLPRNYWIVKNQTNGYSMDSVGNPTVANDKAQTSGLIPLDRSSQMFFMGWGGHTNDQVTVAYFDSNKKMISSIIWTQLKELTGPITIEFWKYGPSAASYVKINANFGVEQHMMVCSEVFQNADWVPALEDLKNGNVDLSNYYDKETVDSKLAASNVYPKHAVIDLTTVGIEIADLSWVTHGGRLEITQLSETEGFMDLNMIVECRNVQPHNTVWENKLTIPLTGFSDLAPDGSMYGYATGYPSYTDGGVFFSTFVENNKAGKFSIGFRTVAGDIGANDWRVINLHLPLGKG